VGFLKPGYRKKRIPQKEITSKLNIGGERSPNKLTKTGGEKKM